MQMINLRLKSTGIMGEYQRLGIRLICQELVFCLTEFCWKWPLANDHSVVLTSMVFPPTKKEE